MNSQLVKNINEIFHDIESRNYDERHPEIIIGEKKWWNQLSNKYIKNETKKSRIMLDIATGNGFVPNIVLNYLNDGDKIIGHDLSLEMLKQSKIKIKNNNFHTIQGDAEKLPFKDKSLDIVTVNTAIHHFPDLQSSLQEIDRVLKKEGILIVGREPNKKFFDSSIVKMLTRIYNFVWGIKMDKDMRDEINKKLKEKGLIDKNLSNKEIIEFVEYNSIPEHDGVRSTDDSFSPDTLLEYFKDYEILEYTTISTFIYRSILPFKDTLNKILKKILNNEGSMFSIILKKK